MSLSPTGWQPGWRQPADITKAVSPWCRGFAGVKGLKLRGCTNHLIGQKCWWGLSDNSPN